MTDLAYNILKSPKDLKPHPISREIYGDEVADDDLIQSIKEKGILESIVIKDDDTIISGHRRVAAAKILALKKVPCRIMTFADPIEEELALIEFNRQRRKRFSQLMRESDHLYEIETVRAKARMMAGTPSPDLDKGRATEKTGEMIGMKRMSFIKARKVWTFAQGGNETAKKLVKQLDEEKKTLDAACNELKKELKRKDRRDELAEKSSEEIIDGVELRVGDFFMDYTSIPEGSIDCIITDPPYVKDWLDNYENVAIAASHVLKPGGFLIMYVGHIHLDKILAAMTPFINYYWIMCLIHAGTVKAVHARSVQCGMKPILVFQKPPTTKTKRYFNDVIEGKGREKDAHDWQQGEAELVQIFEPFTDPGDTVLDPFMGSGTVIAMAKKLSRRAIGYDIDPENVKVVKGRLSS